MTALVKPAKTVWIDGSAEQLKALRDEAISTAEMELFDQEKLPGCLPHRTRPSDVARVEGRTFICPRKKENAAPPTTGKTPRSCARSWASSSAAL